MVFIEQRNGKKHPCNPEPVVSGELEIGDKMIADDGRIIVIKADSETDISGYLSHFSTCPNADEFRRD